MQKETLPLITPVDSHDATGILRELFREVLQKPKYPEQLISNLSTYNIDNKLVQEGAKCAQQIIDSTSLHLNEIGVTEECLMYVKAKYLEGEFDVGQDAVEKETRCLKKRCLFPDLEMIEREKYGLLSRRDLLPSRLQRVTGDDLRHSTNQTQKVAFVTSAKSNPMLEAPMKSILKLKPKKGRKEVRVSIASSCRRKPTKKCRSSTTTAPIVQHEEVKEFANPFRLSCDVVAFVNYELNKTYKKKFYMQNSTNAPQSFSVQTPREDGSFRVRVESDGARLSPGLKVVFVVEFRADDYVPREDFIAIYTGTISFHVRLESYRDEPNLFVFVQTDECRPMGLSKIVDARSLALNNSVDCKPCFRGLRTYTNLVVKNGGGRGRFFFVSEDDWFGGRVEILNSFMELRIGNFTVYPAHFEIDAGEFVIVHVSYDAGDFGMDLAAVYLMCDNLTFEVVHLMADSVMIDRYSVSVYSKEFVGLEELDGIFGFDGPHPIDDSEKNTCATLQTDSTTHVPPNTPLRSNVTSSSSARTIDFEEDVSNHAVRVSKYLLHYGDCVPYGEYSQKIHVENNSQMHLRCKWVLDRAVDLSADYPEVNSMDESWLDIGDAEVCLQPYAVKSFTASISPRVNEPGYYAAAYSLYVQSIPKEAVENIRLFEYKENVEDGLLDLLVAKIYLLLAVVKIEITLMPDTIIIESSPRDNKTLWTTVAVKLSHFYKELICGQWITKSKAIHITPETFELSPQQQLYKFRVSIDYENVAEDVEFCLDEGISKVLPVRRRVRDRHMHICSLLDFGYLERGNTYVKRLTFTNDDLSFVMSEIEVDRSAKNVSFVVEKYEKTVDLCIFVQALEEQESVYFKLYGVRNDQRQLHVISMIRYKVDNVNAYMHTSTSQFPVLCPSELLFVDTKTTHVVCLHNDACLETAFTFGRPIGQNASRIKVDVTPPTGILRCCSVVRVNVTLTPLAVGILEDVFVPCYFSNCNPELYGAYLAPEPIVLAVMCAVEGILVTFTVPTDDGQQTICWPPEVEADVDEDYVEDEEKSCDVFKNNFDDTELDICEDMFAYLNSIIADEEDEERDETTDETAEMSLSTDNEPFKFGDAKRLDDLDFTVQKYFVNFGDVPRRKPIKRTITITNITPVPGEVTCEVVNFPPMQGPRRKIDQILIDLNLKEDDQWDKIVPKEGVVVKVEPEKAYLEPHGSVTIDVWVYALTWGVYVDEVVVDINAVQPFCFSVIANVRELPIEFPVAMNCTNKIAAVRFGNISYKSGLVTRKVYVKNTSTIPVSIIWHMYMKLKPERVDKPFVVVFDVFHPNLERKLSERSSVGNVVLTSAKFCDVDESQIFTVSPKETFIEGGRTTSLNVVFDPMQFAAQFVKTHVKAYLVGYIYISSNYRHQPNIYRACGNELDVLKLKIELTMELPRLELLDGDVDLNFYAPEMLAQRYFTHRNVLTFKNTSDCEAVVRMDIDVPFHVVNLRSCHSDPDRCGDSACVRPGEAAELELVFELDQAELDSVAGVLYNKDFNSVYAKSIDYEAYSYRKEKMLRIKQKGFLRQTIPLYYTIHFPRVEVDSQVDFGWVYIGNVKRSYFTIRNYTGCPVPFNLSTTGELLISPLRGVLPSASFNRPGKIEVSVTFIPQEYKPYTEIIELQSNVPSFYELVKVEGYGLHDEKFQKDNLY